MVFSIVRKYRFWKGFVVISYDIIFPTKETPFNMVYDAYSMFLVKIDVPTWWRDHFTE